MTHPSRSKPSPTHASTLAVRTRAPSAQNHITTPTTGDCIPTQADRCPFPGCMSRQPHQHPTAAGHVAPSIDAFRKAGAGTREHWSEEQRRRIADDEAVLRQLAEPEPGLPVKTHLPRGNDLTVEEQIAIIHGGATPALYEAAREMLLERHRQDIVENTSPISPVFPARMDGSHADEMTRAGTERSGTVEWDDFPELDARFASSGGRAEDPGTLDPRLLMLPNPLMEASCNGGNGTDLARSTTLLRRDPPCQTTDFLNTETTLCTGPCPVQTPHNKGAYLQRGQVPRVWNERWGYFDPPREIWEAWVRMKQGCGRTWDEVEVDGFALSHWWAGP